MNNSEWCLARWSEAVERGDTAAAKDYEELYQIWKGRESK